MNVVLDTNIVLDLFVFNDATALALREALNGSRLDWLATAPMRDELQRVLTYPQIVKSLVHHQTQATEVLAHFDGCAQTVAVPAKAPLTCRDPDDQKFIDLAVAHHARLLSKDQAVLCMGKRLAALGVSASAAMVFDSLADQPP